ncbi:nuclear transport factor 2 family protein [Ramlibacter pallidus]|uniref:Nuclear transport factor 2 family protein n=1 Tax=Ramlibacter pallidus TaxID=2780087 RepID=A0ABR9S6P2_9BURK|nr:nuclear transport factor 2 family protein [Ramlibacter pallidus]MBE7368962.1 nuclear transport factor 2 family protein [Ramlibacter pallidus]
MQQEQAKRSVMDAWQAFGSRDAERIRACLAPDVQWLAPPGNATAVALDYTHHMVGPDSIVHFLVALFPRLFVADVQVEFGRVLCDGREVILEERMRATLANGRPYENDYCFIFTLDAEGRIERVREYMDTRKGQECIFGAA